MLLSVQSARGPALSVTIHCAAVALLFLAGTNSDLRHAVTSTLDRVILTYPKLPPGPGGGGSGDGSLLRASRGRPPKIAPRQFTPPAVVLHNLDPKLPMAPSIVLPADVKLPQVDLLA